MTDIIVVPLLAVHLLAMNVASAGPLTVAWLLQGSAAPADRRRLLAQRLARHSMLALLVGLLLGGGLLLVPHTGLRAALQRFPAKEYWFAGIELLFSAACMGLLIRLAGGTRRRPVLAWLLALLASSNLLYHFPPLMIVLGELAADSAWAREAQLDRAAILRLWMRPEVAALWAHFTLASLAAAPIAAMWPLRGNNEVDAGASASLSGRLAIWALTASVLQLPVGAWVVWAADGASRDAIMGSSLIASVCFLGGVVTALGLVQTLAHTAFGDHRAATLRRSAWMFALVALLMTATLRTSRNSPKGALPPQAARLK